MNNNAVSTFTCTLEEFKRAVAEFCQAAPTCDEESLENGFKAVGLMYLGLPDDELTILTAAGYLDYASRRNVERELELLIDATGKNSLQVGYCEAEAEDGR